MATTNKQAAPGTHSLYGTSPRGDRRVVKFEVASEALVHVAEFELSPVSGWVRVAPVQAVRADLARRWYAEFVARGYSAEAPAGDVDEAADVTVPVRSLRHRRGAGSAHLGE